MPPSDTEYEVAGSSEVSNRKGFFFSFLYFSIVAICIILFIVSCKHTIDIHTTETKRREVMGAEDNTAAVGTKASRRRLGGWLYGRHIMEQQK